MKTISLNNGRIAVGDIIYKEGHSLTITAIGRDKVLGMSSRVNREISLGIRMIQNWNIGEPDEVEVLKERVTILEREVEREKRRRRGW